MKRILVPVDFSKAAKNALRYALNFSKPFKAEINCLHVIEDASGKEEAQLKLQNFIAENCLTDPARITVKNIVIPGILENVVNEFINTGQVDLILMGTKGAAGFQKMLGGSNTTDLLASTSLPVLIIPQRCVFRFIKVILWASDFIDPGDSNDLKTVVETAKAFDAEVRIAHVKTPGQHGSITQKFEGSLLHQLMTEEGVKHSLKKIRWTDISGGLKYYLQLKGDIDMLVMVRRKHGFLSRVFRQDHTYEFACNPTLPLLIVHE